MIQNRHFECVGSLVHKIHGLPQFQLSSGISWHFVCVGISCVPNLNYNDKDFHFYSIIVAIINE